MSRDVEDWLASQEDDEWSQMMRKVAAFHHKHDFAGNNGHDMGYRIALTVEELGELAAAVTKGKPIEECADCLLYTSPSPRDLSTSRMPSSA